MPMDELLEISTLGGLTIQRGGEGERALLTTGSLPSANRYTNMFWTR
jgi:hypothetical protein